MKGLVEAASGLLRHFREREKELVKTMSGLLRKAPPGQKGFTLVEVLLVIVLIGIITAIALPRFVGHADRARTSVVLAELQSMKTVVELHYAEAGRLPAASVLDQAGTVRRVMNDGGINWGGPSGIVNPWGKPYHYATAGTRYIVYTEDNAGAPGVCHYVTDAHPPGTGPRPQGYDLAGPVPSRS
ncbi:prepilin-type N-terminal cleavage/methylation domain-containing protein [Candidatus Desulforudis audaxviator]|uniref:General secretion pathway protein G n=1 Tax=Desulforudis audaxviator (strain MP104C) TaxID=477974 RepID=B1I3A3_DESAP|nr:prepilin-type N-terminal cleavage/methylation domain-containing protein [Candidatus Desulforudis audaxviator]ACA59505.1 hypothetical protein Daud_0993 [Candidatus Desulforudis audaxviator MP104C]AZK59488.1 hypothetical protein Daudx_0936 [Candidatus Desulforudis audaxviator]